MKYITTPTLDKLVDGKWIQTHMKDLKIGDRFRMWVYPRKHMKWVSHKDQFGNTEWTASSDPYLHPEHRVWTINTAPAEQGE